MPLPAPSSAPLVDCIGHTGGLAASAHLRHARHVVTAVFFAFAFGLGFSAGAIPTLLAQAGLGAAGLGLALVGNSAAYIAAMVLAGRAARRVPVRRLMLAMLVAQALCLVAVFLAGSPLALGLAMAALGAASGALDLAMNTEGTAVERALARPVLTRMHAAASAAFAMGALAGGWLAVDVGLLVCLPPALMASAAAAWAVWRLGPAAPTHAPSAVAAPPATGAALVSRDSVSVNGGAGAFSATATPAAAVPAATPPRSPAQAASATPPLPRRAVLVLGVVLGVCIAAEVTAQMWSARFLQQQASQWAALAGAGAALFAGCQAALRLGGDRLRQRLGDARLIVASLVLAAAGFGVVALADLGAGMLWAATSPAGFLLGLAGFALVGLGTACVVPCAFALLAGMVPALAAEAIGRASLVAGAVRLPAPALVGAVAAAGADGLAFAGLALALLAAAALARRPLLRG